MTRLGLGDAFSEAKSTPVTPAPQSLLRPSRNDAPAHRGARPHSSLRRCCVREPLQPHPASLAFSGALAGSKAPCSAGEKQDIPEEPGPRCEHMMSWRIQISRSERAGIIKATRTSGADRPSVLSEARESVARLDLKSHRSVSPLRWSDTNSVTTSRDGESLASELPSGVSVCWRMLTRYP
ncbi:hypothetical protein EVAR_76054_1 [Eumeta japonica]|uniref:Uncharacterized protein n=1 Tax=Eumeta variegata TaxID=151549 RepID=A0A4C1W5G0_EUMVA|nr:hypothetical protein EVAR_76054_1 [Eumeta japonica]